MVKKSNDTSAKLLVEKLEGNPFLMSYLLLDPVSAAEMLGFEWPDLFSIKGSAKDIAAARNLRENDFKSSGPQVIQYLKNPALLTSPTLTAANFGREPDVTTHISAGFVRHAIESYPGPDFYSESSDDSFPGKSWHYQLIGQGINAGLSQGGIDIDIKFTLVLDFAVSSGRVELAFPLFIQVLPALGTTADTIYLSPAKGQICALNFVLPESIASTLPGLIGKIMPYVELGWLPRDYQLQKHLPPAPTRLTGCSVDNRGLTLSFHLDEYFAGYDAAGVEGADKANKVVHAVHSSPAALASPAASAVPVAVASPASPKPDSYPSAVLSENWAGQPGLWNYDNYSFSDETFERSSGQAVMGTICDFFDRNPFTLKPKEELTGADGKVHYDHSELLGHFYDWYPPEMTLGENRVSGTEEILRALSNLKLNPEDSFSDAAAGAGEAQKTLIDWIAKSRLPVIVLLDLGELSMLENLASGANDAAPRKLAAHWAIVYAVNKNGVKVASRGNEYFIPWAIFMDSWRCGFLPESNNYFQIKVSLKN